jgi:hypothetical protein
MQILVVFWLVTGLLLTGTTVLAQDATIERVLRTQVFNKTFEGFEYYHVTIEEDQPQADGSREVIAVASGKFLNNTARLKALFLIVDEQVIGGQILENTGLPPCLAPGESRSSL